MRSFTESGVVFGMLLILAAGCEQRDKQGETSDESPREHATATSTADDTGADVAPEDVPALPPGHPPIGDAAAAPEEEESPDTGQLTFSAPEGWETVAPRNRMIQESYSLPAQKEDVEEAVLEVTYFPGMKNIPFSNQVDRWARQFVLPEGGQDGDAKKQTTVEGGEHPIQLLDIRGTYQGSRMMGGGPDEPQENYRMLAAQIDGPTGPSFVKLTGPNETVTYWEKAFMNFIRTAE